MPGSNSTARPPKRAEPAKCRAADSGAHALTGTLMPGDTIGALSVIGFTDKTAKRVVAKCICKKVVQVSVESLNTGAVTSCGCRSLSPQQMAVRRSEIEQHQRQREQKRWKPGGRT